MKAQTDSEVISIMATLQSKITSELVVLDRLIKYYSDLVRWKTGFCWILEFGCYCLKRTRDANGQEHHMTKKDLDYVEIYLIKFKK